MFEEKNQKDLDNITPANDAPAAAETEPTNVADGLRPVKASPVRPPRINTVNADKPGLDGPLPGSLLDSIPRMKTPSNPWRGMMIWMLVVLVLGLAAIGGFYYYNNWRIQSENAANVVVFHHQPQETASTTPSASQSASTTPALVAGVADGSTTTASTSPISAAPTTTPAAAPASQLKILSTPTGYLNVRSKPATSGSVVTKVNPGETYDYDQVENGWYRIVLSEGTYGWVTGQYVEKIK